MSPDWPLMRRILALLADEGGLADVEIAERLGRPATDVQQAARVLYRQRKVDLVAGYLVIAPRREGRPAA